jgi:hypothetical protein
MLSAIMAIKIPAIAESADHIMALRSPTAFTNLAAGTSAKSVPSITKPAISPAVGKSAPKRSALAGIIGISAYSPIEKRAEGTKTDVVS